jgi:hypothetical protein
VWLLEAEFDAIVVALKVSLVGEEGLLLLLEAVAVAVREGLSWT